MVTENPALNKKGTTKRIAQKAEILPKFWCQKCGDNNGNIAIDNKIPTKGITHKIDNSEPSRCGALPSAPKRKALKEMIVISIFFIFFIEFLNY